MLIKLDNLELAFANQPPLFQGLSCTIPDGQLVALLGPSGSGKTTLLNIIAGLLTPDRGRVWFDDTDVTQQAAGSRQIGMVFQDYALYPHLTVLNNIAFPLKMAHVKRNVRLEQAQKMAHLVRLDAQLNQYPNELSGGQQQRVALARALVKHPRLLLLDESLSNLDVTLRTELRQEIRRIQRATHTTTLFVTHDQNDALHIADHIILMHQGQIQQTGTGNDLYQHPQNQFVAQFIGTPQMSLLPINIVKTQLTNVVPANQLAQATTIGIRSAALSTQHNTTQHNTTQHNTTQHNTVYRNGTATSQLGALF